MKQPSKRNFWSAVIVFFVATAMQIWGLDVWVLYGFAALFFISWEFDKLSWQILEIARILTEALALKKKEAPNDRT